jgi:hypothetical protein
VDIERHLLRGELELAIAVARDSRRAHGRPIPLEVAVKFLPVIARERPGSYSAWALRWLYDWLPQASSIDQALDMTAALAELPCEPDDAIKTLTGQLQNPRK